MHLRGVPLAVIATWLGHRDVESVARTYAHSQADELAAAASVIGDVTSPVTRTVVADNVVSITAAKSD
jgi:integrase